MSPDAGPREERRVVTVVFTDLVGFTERSEELDPEDVRAFLARYYAAARSTFEEHGGTVDKFIGDAVLAIFGAPVAHEDDPERAVRAALAICEWARATDDLGVRIGVNTGSALVALEQSETGIGMVAGDAVNTAARIQAAAPTNGVLVGESTRDAIRDVFELAERDAIEAKGKREPVRVWEVLAAPAPGGRRARMRTAFVGRNQELTELRTILGAVRTELQPRLVLLTGEPGVGKTRLVAELEGAARELDSEALWLHGRAVPYGAGTSLRGLGELVRAYTSIMETDDAATARSKLERAVGALTSDTSDARWLVSQLRPLVGLSGDVEGRDDGRADAFAAWRHFFELLARDRTLVLALEDLHWAGAAVLDFLDELVTRTGPASLLVVGTARPELLQLRPAWSEGASRRKLVRLEPLSDELTAELVRELTAGLDVDEVVEHTLLDRAAGNPLYAEEFVRMLAEGGRAPDAALPQSVQGVVAARLDALTPAEKALLQDACVVGQVFWPDALRFVSDHAAQVDDLLESLERKEFVRRAVESTVAGEPQLVFRHPLIREVAYEQMPRARRAEKHQRAAAWAESLPADRAEARADLLADHYERALVYTTAAGADVAELRVRAAGALHEAGDHARALHSLDVAAARYRRALDLSESAEARAGLGLALGETQLRTGELDDAHRQLDEVIEIARAHGYPVLLARAVLARGGVGVRVFDPDAELVALLEEALKALAADTPELRARLLARLAIEVYYEDPPTYREELSEEAVRLARGTGEADALQDALTARRVTLWSPDRLEERLAVSRELVELAESAGDRERSLVARTWLVLDLVEGGDLNAARAEIDAYARLVEPLGIGAYSWWVLAWQAMLAGVEGRFDDLRALADTAEEIGARAGDTNAAIYRDLACWIADAEQGRNPERWLPLITEGVLRGGPADAFRCGLAMQLALAGRHDGARAALADLGPDGFDAVVKDMNFYAGAAEFTVAVGLLADAAAARQAYAALSPYAGRMIVIARAAVCWGPVDSFLGRLAATAGLLDEAEEYFEAALVTCERVGARAMATRTRSWYSGMLRARAAAGDAERAAELAGLATQEAAMLGLALEPVSG